jgi:hypothetical protein
VNKNLTNDPRIGFLTIFNLVDLIEANAKLKKELEKFKRIFERMRFWKYNLLFKKIV